MALLILADLTSLIIGCLDVVILSSLEVFRRCEKTLVNVFVKILLDDKNPLVNGFSHLRETMPSSD